MTNESEFKSVLTLARECEDSDEQHLKTNFRGLFDSSEFCTTLFFSLLQDLMRRAEDDRCYYVVLDPDPLKYFWFHFKKYPSIEIESHDAFSAYTNALNEDPGGSPADAIGINWAQYVIAPRSKKWFVTAHRDETREEGGHLYVPVDWRDWIISAYPPIEFA